MDCDDFPPTLRALNEYSSARLNALLNEYELPTQGNMNVRRFAFRRHIGVVVAVDQP
ncbi:hypothetical protein K440DRAFT_620552 [Wilcoxina mikolae CBS 423.85]|nr:hypothetical protein K440DRAFT_620552 [Wilcoxina mikolae CBS 423.85]